MISGTRFHLLELASHGYLAGTTDVACKNGMDDFKRIDGKDCGLCKDPQWTLEKKKIP